MYNLDGECWFNTDIDSGFHCRKQDGLTLRLRLNLSAIKVHVLYADWKLTDLESIRSFVFGLLTTDEWKIRGMDHKRKYEFWTNVTERKAIYFQEFQWNIPEHSKNHSENHKFGIW